MQGITVYMDGDTAPNGVTINASYKINNAITNIPDLPVKSIYAFSVSAYSTGLGKSFKKLSAEQYATGTDYVQYNTVFTMTDGSETTTANGMTNYDNYSNMGFALIWTEIVAPGTVVNDVEFPYGAAKSYGMRQFKGGAGDNGYWWYIMDGGTLYIPFSSEAEYAAAVG